MSRDAPIQEGSQVPPADFLREMRQSLPAEMEGFLRSTNPWWEGKPAPETPPYRRWAFNTLLRRMDIGLAPAVVLRGPRQVGKTILQRQLIGCLLSERQIEPRRIMLVRFEEIPLLNSFSAPLLAIARWFEQQVLGCSFNEAARNGKPAYLFFDEIQNQPYWAPQLKALVDNHPLKAQVTGSSALRIEAGRDSLAGRVTTIELGTFLLREIAELRFGGTLPRLLPENGLDPLLRKEFWQELQQHGLKNKELRDRAFAAFSERGGYPIAHARAETPWPEIAAQLNETIIRRAIQHDLRSGKKGARRDQDLLEEVYRLACRYAGQSPGEDVFVKETKKALDGNIKRGRILNYLKFLDGTLLLKLVPPLELRLKRRQGNNKICLCDHGLRASWLREIIPLDEAALAGSPQSDLAGHIAESVTGYFLASLPDLGLAHFPERGKEPEVDFVLTVGDKRIPLEVKYRRTIDPQRDTMGLCAFLEKEGYSAPFGILVTLCDGVQIADPRIVPVSLPSLLLMR
ncbi:MAG: AAA family ATPase [Planctomycetota bacterium]